MAKNYESANKNIKNEMEGQAEKTVKTVQSSRYSENSKNAKDKDEVSKNRY